MNKQHNAIMRALSRVTLRNAALTRLHEQRVDVTAEQEAQWLGHRAVGFWGHGDGVAGPKHKLP